MEVSTIALDIMYSLELRAQVVFLCFSQGTRQVKEKGYTRCKVFKQMEQMDFIKKKEQRICKEQVISSKKRNEDEKSIKKNY
jgi:hypothetical protein